MPSLTIQCRYIAHSYTGVRQDRDLRDQLDWPPAPARLHQALIASTLANLPDSLRDAFARRTLDALRWLEAQGPPEIIASRLADDSGHRRTLLIAMPHNSPAKGDFSRYHPDLAPVLRATPDHNGALFVEYRWTCEAFEFSRDAETHLPALHEAAAKLRYLGRAEDRVECEVHWQTDRPEEPVSDSCEMWRPSTQAEDASLLTARPQSTDELIAEFDRASERRAREAKRPARLFLHGQSYARDAAEALLPVHVAVFQILRDSGNPDELPVACDAVNAHRWRSPLRNLACKIARESDRWNDPELAAELISGHAPSGERTRQPHLAFVPLPSLSLHGKADGRVRRFALLGYADASRVGKGRADSIYRTLAACLDCELLPDVEPFHRLRLIEDHVRQDKVWSHYSRSSRVWISATPVAIARGFKVPTRSPDGQLLSKNERYLRRQAELTSLLRTSLCHIRLPNELVASCKISITSSPLLAATERAERYRPIVDSARFVHARLEFCRPVRGPLLLGDRRFAGFGLFAPAE